MTKHSHVLALVCAVALALSVSLRAQEKPAAPATPNPPVAVTPVKVQLVISRYQGEKKVSSLPYTLSVSAGARATLRMGAKVPVAQVALPAPDGKAPAPMSYSYQDLGTNIDCYVFSPVDGQFRVEITIDDSSIYDDSSTSASKTVPGVPSFRSFRASDSMVLKDGGTAQFTTATDKVSGEIVKVDVTLTVVK